MLKLYNTLTRKVEEFKPLNPPKVGMYACGPTVYDFQHIGHMRRYVGDDILVRVLKENGFQVKEVINITDVGHLVSDADFGEDKMEKGAKKFQMSVWEIAKIFEEQFFDSAKKLNIIRPDIVMRATEYIKNQIELIQILEKKGYTYKIEDGIYFDTSKFPKHSQLSFQTAEELKAGARVEMVPGKKQPTDFALWKFSPKDEKRQMEWESPWGVGFPGWHIECSAMSMLSLGETFDIHTGGIDHIAVHHTNEIIQSEAASGKPFVHYWVHHGFLLVNGQKMSKSLGNIYTVSDVIQKRFEPLALRYLYLQTHYRQEMNFTWEALEGAQTALQNLKFKIENLKLEPDGEKHEAGCAEYSAKGGPASGWEKRFLEAVNNDLNMPEALAVVWELVKSDYPTGAKAESLFKFDKILGLDLAQAQSAKRKAQKEGVQEEIMKLVKEREQLRKQGRYHLADQLRNKIKKLGFLVEDKNEKSKISKINSPANREECV